MAAQYVLQDRTTGQRYALSIDNAELNIDETIDAAQSDIIVEDISVPGHYYEIFMDNGELNWESTVTVQDDMVQLSDPTLLVDWLLQISYGELIWEEFTAGFSIHPSKPIAKELFEQSSKARELYEQDINSKEMFEQSIGVYV